MTSKSCNRKTIIFLIIFLLIILLVILLVWGILQPSKPVFILEEATVVNFNVSGDPPSTLTSNFEFTLSSRNPNDKIGIDYDRLNVYASYRSQRITFPTPMPGTYQGNNEASVWSPLVGGYSVSIAPYNAMYLDQDFLRGEMMLVVHLDGRVRWKVGTFVTGRYHLNVRCPAFINFGKSATGVIDGNDNVTYALSTSCSVSV